MSFLLVTHMNPGFCLHKKLLKQGRQGILNTSRSTDGRRSQQVQLPGANSTNTAPVTLPPTPLRCKPLGPKFLPKFENVLRLVLETEGSYRSWHFLPVHVFPIRSWMWLPLNSQQQQLQIYSEGNPYAFQALPSPSPKHLVAFNEITGKFIDPALPPEISGKQHKTPPGRIEFSASSSSAISFSSGNKMLLTRVEQG